MGSGDPSAPAKTSLLPFPGNQVGGAPPPTLVPFGLEEQRHGFRLVAVAALGGHHHLPMEAEPDDRRGQGS